MAGFGDDKTLADLRRGLYLWVLVLICVNATPVIIIEGDKQAPGSGKWKKAEARARAANLDVRPRITERAFYQRGARWLDRTILSRLRRKRRHDDYTFEEWRDTAKADAEEMGLLVVRCHDECAEGEAAGAHVTLDILQGIDKAPCFRLLTTDKDAFCAYGGRTFAFRESSKNTDDDDYESWYESLEVDGVLRKLNLHSHEDVQFLSFILGVGDHEPPIEAVIPVAARSDRAKAALDRLRRANVTDVDRKVLNDVLNFVRRFSLKARNSGRFTGALSAFRHLASLPGNDDTICSQNAFDTYVAPFLGEHGSEKRNTIVYFLEAWVEETKHGGARALCGEGASNADLINKRMEIRAAPFPSEIVDLDTVEEVYDWLNTLFGGDHLPDRATEPEKYDAFIKKLEKVRAARSGG